MGMSMQDYDAIERAKLNIENIFEGKAAFRRDATIQETRLYFQTWVLPELEKVLNRHKDVKLSREERKKAAEERLREAREWQARQERQTYESLKAKFEPPSESSPQK